MYAQHFGLRAEAFSLTPDPAFLYLSPDHAEALAALKVGLEGRRGLMVMVGEVGTGKTTLLYSLLTELGAGIRTAYVSNTRLSFDGILRQVVADFGVPCRSRDRVELLGALNAFLRRCAAKGATAALVIDEAQNLEDDAFENLRLLSNYETYTEKLLQIVLVGQPELETKLRRPALRQVAERVAVRCNINPLSRRESLRYVEHRLQCVAGSTALFTPAALRLLLRKSRGIPRRINILCHNALLFAYGRGLVQVSRSLVRLAVREKQGQGLVTFGDRHASRRARSVAGFALRPSWITALAAAGVAIAFGWGYARVQSRAIPPATTPSAPERAAPGAPLDSRPVVETVEEVASATVPAERAGEGGVAVESPAASAVPPPRTEAAAPQSPPRFREVLVRQGNTLLALARQHYGDVNQELLKRIKAANPKVADVDRILAGDTLRFPEIDAARPGATNVRHE